MTTAQKQGVIFLLGLMAILLWEFYGPNRSSNISVEANIHDSSADVIEYSSCNGATQWTPHGPYVGPVE
jgi:hypothetical protein